MVVSFPHLSRFRKKEDFPRLTLSPSLLRKIKTEIFAAMREYVELFTQVVAEFDMAAAAANNHPNPNHSTGNNRRTSSMTTTTTTTATTTQICTIGVKEGVTSPGHLWGYAIIRFARRIRAYQVNAKVKGKGKEGGVGGGGGGGGGGVVYE